MHDPQFGLLKWNSGTWEGSARFPQFAEWGAAFDEKDPPDTRPAERPDRSPTKGQVEAGAELRRVLKENAGCAGVLLGFILTSFARRFAQRSRSRGSSDAERTESPREKLLRQGVCDVTIEAQTDGEERSEPLRAQRVAWEAMLARGPTLWNELLEKSFATYQRQLPVRRTWWRAIYGDYLLDRRLPEVATIQQFSRLIRASIFRVKRPAGEGAPADISVYLRATWAVDGMDVIIREGHVTDAPDESRETIEHPVFGVLRRIPSDDPMEYINQWEKPTRPGVSGFANAKRMATRPWNGLARFDPLLEFALVADERAQYAHDRANADPPASRMAWEFANGQFDLRVYAPAGQPPDDAQAKAWMAFCANEKQHAAAMIDSIFEQYQETCAVRRRNYKDRYVDENVPILTGKSGLRELIQLRHIHVHPPDGEGRVTIAFQFVAAYDHDGFSAMWREGKFSEWGTWKDAEYRGLE
jgi:hypothetical protein